MSEAMESAPILKWAGGKTQLLPTIKENLPKELLNNQIDTYIEPFFGGGALFFELLKDFSFKKVVLNDFNKELFVLYSAIQKDVNALVKALGEKEESYLSLDTEGRKAYYYDTREKFNLELEEFNFDKFSKSWATRAASILFLNRTCFNGLFRVNKKGQFNVPQGSYKNPKILNEVRLRAVSAALKDVEFFCGDYEAIRGFVNDKTLIYYDPPYRPLNMTSSFKSYSANDFNDEEQIRLGQFYRDMDKLGAKQILSNSDPKNTNEEDNFFDDIFEGYEIQRVLASRRINSKSASRGDITEILVKNF